MYKLERELLISAPRDEVFRFFEDPGNLEQITPPWVGFQDLTVGSPPMSVGLPTAHKLRWFGISLRWESQIIEYSPSHRFVDEQTKGPYAYWRHEHVFEDADGSTLMTDHVQYGLPFGILGAVVHGLLVARQIRKIFDYRAMRIKQIFQDGSSGQS